MEELFQIFNANEKFNVPYWMGGPKNLSYVGSSIHLFQNYQFASDSRVKQHITHAAKHRTAISHNCKLPLLYGAMGMNLDLWYMRPIANIVNAEHTTKKSMY